MTYFSDLHTYLHHSSLLIQAYPQTTRITTKYSLPQKLKASKSTATSTEANIADAQSSRPKREPSATLTLKTYHPDSGICLKYKTDKAAEVGRLITGLGRLAKGEIIDVPAGDGAEVTAGAGIDIGSGQVLSGTDKMEIDARPAPEAKTATQMTQASQQQQAGGGKNKKKGKK